MKKKLLKRCTRCGHEQLYRPRVIRCRFKRYGPRSLWCYGRLVLVETVKKLKRPQDVAQHKLKHARQEIDECNEQLQKLAKKSARVSQRIRKLEAFARRQAAVASMTDEEVEAVRQKARTAKEQREDSKRNRRIDLDE